MKYHNWFLSVLILCLSFGTSSSVYAIASNIDATYKTASLVNSDSGYISFVTSGPGAVIVGNTRITGTATSPYGTIYFTTDSNAVTNDGSGRLSGKAWNSEMGWIDFAPTDAKAVSIDVATGQFRGFAKSQFKGWIQFDCSAQFSCVKTSWKPGNNSEKINYTSSAQTVPVVIPAGTSNNTNSSVTPLPDIKNVTTENLSCDDTISGMSVIVYGDEQNKSTDVVLLQKFLNRYENAGLVVDGEYKTTDVLAVKDWQEKHASAVLTPLGIRKASGNISLLSVVEMARVHKSNCGFRSAQYKITQKMLLQPFCPYFDVQKQYGDTGVAVSKIQYFLSHNEGLKVAVTGVFDVRTVNAVKAFQRYNGIKPENINGIWGTHTMNRANQAIGCE